MFNAKNGVAHSQEWANSIPTQNIKTTISRSLFILLSRFT